MLNLENIVGRFLKELKQRAMKSHNLSTGRDIDIPINTHE